MRYSLLVLSTAALVTGCAGLAQSGYRPGTPSGLPEVTIRYAPRAEIRDTLISHMLAAQYRLADQTESHISFERDPGVTEQVLLGIGSHARVEVTFLGTGTGVGADTTVRVIASATEVSPSLRGETRQDITKGKAAQQLMVMLWNVQVAIDHAHWLQQYAAPAKKSP